MTLNELFSSDIMRHPKVFIPEVQKLDNPNPTKPGISEPGEPAPTLLLTLLWEYERASNSNIKLKLVLCMNAIIQHPHFQLMDNRILPTAIGLKIREIIDYLLDRVDISLHTQARDTDAILQPYHTTPLMIAASLGDLETAQKLLERGVDVAEKIDYPGYKTESAAKYHRTALSFAAMGNGNEKMLALLLNGRHPAEIFAHEISALPLATANGNINNMHILKAAGANPQFRVIIHEESDWKDVILRGLAQYRLLASWGNSDVLHKLNLLYSFSPKETHKQDIKQEYTPFDYRCEYYIYDIKGSRAILETIAKIAFSQIPLEQDIESSSSDTQTFAIHFLCCYYFAFLPKESWHWNTASLRMRKKLIQHFSYEVAELLKSDLFIDEKTKDSVSKDLQNLDRLQTNIHLGFLQQITFTNDSWISQRKQKSGPDSEHEVEQYLARTEDAVSHSRAKKSSSRTEFVSDSDSSVDGEKASSDSPEIDLAAEAGLDSMRLDSFDRNNNGAGPSSNP